MGYRRAEELLPAEIIELIQQYVDGQTIYIPRKADCRKGWGEGTRTRQELRTRNHLIYEDYRSGRSIRELAEMYFLSEKSIQRIIRVMR